MGMVDYHRVASRERLLRGETPDWIRNSKRGPYIRQVVLSIPPWQDRKELQALKAEAARLTRETGVLHVLAHKIPLTHSLVCGLTVPWNLRILTWRQNLAEKNHFLPDQMNLFD